MVAARTMTAADLAALPDDERGELLDGVLAPMTPVKEEHWRIVSKLFGAIAAYLGANDLGIVGAERGYLLRTDPDTVLAPDLSFVAYRRNVRDRDIPGFARLAPDLAIEVRSPANSGAELARKVNIYLAAGCPLVWVVDPASRTVTVHSPDREPILLADDDHLSGENILPGFSVLVAALFA